MKLLVFGDSLSDGGWERDPQGLGSAWPSVLSRLVGESGGTISVTNRSKGGARSVEILSAFREMDTCAFDVMAVFAGTNDLWRRWVPWRDQAPVDTDDFGRNLTSLCRLARERDIKAVWILTPCLLHLDVDHVWNREMLDYRETCVRVARQQDAKLIPTGEEFEAAVRAVPGVKWTYDGVHPRPVGQARLAWTVYHHAMGGAMLQTDHVPGKPVDHRIGEWP